MAEMPVGILVFPGGEIKGETDINVQFRNAKNPGSQLSTKDGLDLLSYSFSGNTAGSSQAVGGLAGGKVELQQFHFSKKLDKATANLFQYLCTAKMIKEAHFVVLRQATKGGDQESNLETYYSYCFTNLIISSYSTGGSPGDDGRPHEDCSFAFEQFDHVWGAQKADQVGGWVKCFYNQKTQVGG